MADAKESTLTKPPLLDVLSGLMANVKLAQRDGSSMLTECVFQLVIFALLGTKLLELVQLVTTDPLFKMETVLPILIPALFLKATFSVKFGINKLASSALKEVSLMLMVFASLLAPNVILSTRHPEIV